MAELTATLMSRAGFEAYILSLPAVELVHQWGDASVGKVGGKIFALLSGWSTGGDSGLSFKCSDVSFAMLPELAGVRPAPYLARAKWVQVLPGAALGDDELRDYVSAAHQMVASKLPRRQREALGLGAIAAGPQIP